MATISTSASRKSGRVFAFGNALLNVAAGDADLVQHVAIGRDHGMVGLAAQDIDGAAGLIVICAFARRTAVRRRDR